MCLYPKQHERSEKKRTTLRVMGNRKRIARVKREFTRKMRNLSGVKLFEVKFSGNSKGISAKAL